MQIVKKSVNGIYFETFGEITRILQLFEGGKSKQIAMYFLCENVLVQDFKGSLEQTSAFHESYPLW